MILINQNQPQKNILSNEKINISYNKNIKM